jgi:23S rRNA pseudoU1915 N3-methylase RlmH
VALLCSGLATRQCLIKPLGDYGSSAQRDGKRLRSTLLATDLEGGRDDGDVALVLGGVRLLWSRG